MSTPAKFHDLDFGRTHEALKMTPARAAATSVLERFPNHWHLIVQLYREDEDFRELCDHFAECRDVLSNLHASTDADPQLVEEYETLTNELEQEIGKTVDAAA
jgi:hypothetical protein